LSPILDASEVAAETLSFLTHGTAEVMAAVKAEPFWHLLTSPDTPVGSARPTGDGFKSRIVPGKKAHGANSPRACRAALSG